MTPSIPYTTHHYHHRSSPSGRVRANSNALNADSRPRRNIRRPPTSRNKQLDAIGVSGASFTPHAINIKQGENVSSRMTTFLQGGPRVEVMTPSIPYTTHHHHHHRSSPSRRVRVNSNALKADPRPKRNIRRPPTSRNKQLDTIGVSGANFTPHAINIKPGENVSSRITAYLQGGPRAVCVISARGAIREVTLREKGGIVTKEGRFLILSLSGSFMGNRSTNSRGLMVSLVTKEGQVIGGEVLGPLIADSPIQVLVGSFIIKDAQKPKSGTSGPTTAPHTSMVPRASLASDDSSIESSKDNGSSPDHQWHPAGSYNNAASQEPPKNFPDMAWPNESLNLFMNIYAP